MKKHWNDILTFLFVTCVFIVTMLLCLTHGRINGAIEACNGLDMITIKNESTRELQCAPQPYYDPPVGPEIEFEFNETEWDKIMGKNEK